MDPEPGDRPSGFNNSVGGQMNSQDGNRVYLKPGAVESVRTGGLRAIQIFFREQPVPNIGFLRLFGAMSRGMIYGASRARAP